MTQLLERPVVFETTPEPLRQEPLLEVRRLTTEFNTHAGPLRAVNDMSFALQRGRVLAIIGESGSGKSALLRTILGIQPASARVDCEVVLNGVDLLKLSDRQREDLRGGVVSMVFQDPMTALDPIYIVEQQLVETIRRHSPSNGQQAKARARELLDLVQIPSPERRLKAYPFELSGGMRQRLVIAMALASTPKLLLADEQTTALDVTVQGPHPPVAERPAATAWHERHLRHARSRRCRADRRRSHRHVRRADCRNRYGARNRACTFASLYARPARR